MNKTYRNVECYNCFQVLPKNQMILVSHEVPVGRRGLSANFRPNSRTRNGGMSWSWSTGAKYYANRKDWYCKECYKANFGIASRISRNIVKLLIIGIMVFYIAH